MMRIYNYLFYKTYILAKYSRNFDDIPVLGGIMFVAPCVMFNVFTIIFLLEGFGVTDIEFKNKYKLLFALALIGLLLGYYLFNNKYAKIIKQYEKNKNRTIQAHPILVIIIYYGLSFSLLLIAGLFKNKDWVFVVMTTHN